MANLKALKVQHDATTARQTLSAKQHELGHTELTMAAFEAAKEVTVAQLQGFIIVRKWGEEGQVKKMVEMKARGAASHTRPGLLKEAHKVYLAPPFLSSSARQPTPTPPPRPTLNIPAFGEVRPGLLAPSARLAEPAFRDKADRAFVHGFSTQTAASRATRTWLRDLPELGRAADHIAGFMPARLQRHLAKTGGGAKSKSSHWCWSFATDNINTVVALMALEGHLEEDYKPLKWDSALLANDSASRISRATGRTMSCERARSCAAPTCSTIRTSPRASFVPARRR
jgi:hypothetical protein